MDPAVRRFLATHIYSAGQLDMLLMLHVDAARAWTPEDLCEAMRAPEAWVRTQIEGFAASGLLQRRGDRVPEVYCYEPRDANLARVVDALADAVREDRASVVGEIFSQRPSAPRAFSDAFRLRGRGGGDG